MLVELQLYGRNKRFVAEHKLRTHRIPGGGMADTMDLKSIDRKIVLVRVQFGEPFFSRWR